MDRNNRTPLVAGNWKMNLMPAEASQLIGELCPLVEDADCRVALCVPYIDIPAAVAAARESAISIGAQNCHWAKSGAFTGEISAQMLTNVGAEICIVGHSERRQYFGETDETVNLRLKAALDEGMLCIVCVGETLEQREGGETFKVIERQIKGALSDIEKKDMRIIVIAYEPVWAIGTGKTATAEQAGEVCGYIRSLVGELYGERVAKGCRVLYGGSMNAKNAAELLSIPDIDGGLIGGASLKAADFSEIVKAASR